MKFDFVIVGQGLAGTLLSHELIKAGKSVLVIDSPTYSKASLVAAGLVNPVVFRRLTKSWMIDELYPQLEESYAEFESLLQRRIYYPVKIRKVFGKGEDDFWQRKSHENQLLDYLNPTPDYASVEHLKLDFGSGWVEKSGRVDLSALISGYRQWLQVNDQLLEENFDYTQLTIGANEIAYRDMQAEKIIFCEGYRASQNPYFEAVKFKHTKGEVLTIQAGECQIDYILNKAGFLMPVADGEFRLGATYDWDNLNEETTEEAKQQLFEKLQTIYAGSYQLKEHKAGVRSTTHDRRPVLGLHPKYNQIGIFNGMGSKGCMLGPYFSRQFAAFLCNKSSLINREVRLDRYC